MSLCSLDRVVVKEVWGNSTQRWDGRVYVTNYVGVEVRAESMKFGGLECEHGWIFTWAMCQYLKRALPNVNPSHWSFSIECGECQDKGLWGTLYCAIEVWPSRCFVFCPVLISTLATQVLDSFATKSASHGLAWILSFSNRTFLWPRICWADLSFLTIRLIGVSGGIVTILHKANLNPALQLPVPYFWVKEKTLLPDMPLDAQILAY